MPRSSLTLFSLWAFLMLVNSSMAQPSQRSEVGFVLGVFNYTGDLVRTFDLTTSRPAATVFYRSNISRVITFRTALTAGQIAGRGKHNRIDSFAIKRKRSFAIFLIELSCTFEYHCLYW